jgi:hypothetical protein
VDAIAGITQRRVRRVSSADGTYKREPIETLHMDIEEIPRDQIANDLPVNKARKSKLSVKTKPKITSRVLKF